MDKKGTPNTVREHYDWIDNIKTFACLLVLLGHFFQSMTKSGILEETDLYLWFNQTIYFFHVPLFFFCSGFLYQRFSKVYDFISWRKNILKKAVALGVPYFTFSLATWVLKVTLATSSNYEVDGIFDTLFLHPIPPYWYLYCLFLLFVVTPNFRNSKAALTAISIAFLMKIAAMLLKIDIYAIKTVLTYEIWFVLGMLAVFFPISRIKKIFGPIVILLFLILSIPVYTFNLENKFISFAMTLIAVLGFVITFYYKNSTNRILTFFKEYTMPIFLMHTLFASPVRAVIFKLGISSPAVHIVLGLAVSILGPIVAMMIMKKSYWLEFFINPWKIINSKKNK